MKKEFIINHSSHFRKRVGEIEYIIIHCSTLSPLNMITQLDELGLSAHYVIGRDGLIFENLDPENVAFHAGYSSWRGSLDASLNECSIGIELEAPSLGQNKDDYTDIQIEKLCELLFYLSSKYKIKKQNVLGHSDISPSRKPDPGIYFPWKTLYERGFGIGYKTINDLAKEEDEDVLLKTIGYDTTNISAARYSFCRHFFIEEVKICNDIQYLLDNPYPVDFKPNNFDEYMLKLRAIAKIIE